jgi:alkanesulfonate monooxygenase SsuD/methylene tetrahydromethanopterin reductase-like flavin-dependent oxidoreductase (luciferase family)
MSTDPEFYFAHFMPYPDLVADHEDYQSLWVEYPNRFYDPQRGHELYKRYLSELVLADELGFDGLMINEHHSTIYSMMPSPNIIAGALIPQTHQAKICVMGNLLNFSWPNRVAEEYAMLDVLSAGRFECAFPLGTGMEYYANAGQINPTTARERFVDAFEVVLKCWGANGPEPHDGDFYTYRALNPWPVPMQKPHPKIWFVGTGSPETIELAVRYGTGYASVFVPKAQQDRAYASFRQAADDAGEEVGPDRLMMSVFCYVAETDEQAAAEGKDHLLWYFNNALRAAPHHRVPPGYVSTGTLRRLLENSASWGEKMTWEAAQDWRAIVGSPDTVAESLSRWLEETGAGRVLCHLHMGDMPHWKTVKNLTLFMEEVVPRVRGEVGVKLAGSAR